ncbi:hypothetical protein GOBAR_AA12661 [Gossypium barbadense]|uniref:Uncharacterized protein n=1 Tax=Gossypium barbadense TaxID=3634 RepID=A0A2P5XXA4_GOSBA|nr:hypothetical protein GOBAR_AA12661 [Gossypium barbadense]
MQKFRYDFIRFKEIPTEIIEQFRIDGQLATAFYGVNLKHKNKEHRNAYATMVYMGTPRDYEFYVATRVLIRSLIRLQVDADLIAIASLDVPLRWLRALQPSSEVFKDMIHQLETGKANPDGADQGFIGAYFPDLLDQPMFYPHLNGTTLDGHHRLPMGYQMDASYYCEVPCRPNSVITFPGAPWLKPWYWWSWPVLPLGIQWHQNSRQTLVYAAEMPIVMIQSASTIVAYIVPFAIIPRTIHPLVGWTLYFLGSVALSSVAINSFLPPAVPILVPLIGVLGSLLVMACPWYPDGVTRALAVFGYAFCYAPIAWGSMVKVTARLQVSLEKRTNFPKIG